MAKRRLSKNQLAAIHAKGGKPFSTNERVFFAPTYSKAVEFANKDYVKDPIHSLHPTTIHLADKQNPNTDWKTWTGKPIDTRQHKHDEGVLTGMQGRTQIELFNKIKDHPNLYVKRVEKPRWHEGDWKSLYVIKKR